MRVSLLLVILHGCSSVDGWLARIIGDRRCLQPTVLSTLHLSADEDEDTMPPARYDLGIGKNQPMNETVNDTKGDLSDYWIAPQPVEKPKGVERNTSSNDSSGSDSTNSPPTGLKPRTTRRMIAVDNDAQQLRGALWDELHYDKQESLSSEVTDETDTARDTSLFPVPTVFYPDIDLSIPDSVYNSDGSVDLVWDLLKWEAYQEAQREPLLVSFMYSTILNHPSLESSLAFLLANRLQSPMMISTQLQSIILTTLQASPETRRSLRSDMMAVRDRDPACNALTDVFLYFKGFHALQTHRVAHSMDSPVLARYLQAQVSQVFQIDIHPKATLGAGIMLDHGTGIVVGETAMIGHNCSILHHVTLGGSGKAGVPRHPVVGDGVLLGAGATLLGRVHVGEGSQVGAGTLVISDLPAHCVAVGVPARIIGSFVDVTEQPALEMNQMLHEDPATFFGSDGI